MDHRSATGVLASQEPRVGVLVGGLLAERDLSVRAGEAIIAALRASGREALPIFVDRDVDLALRQARVGVAFLALRGRYGGDGCLEGLLEILGIPYTGSGVLASALTADRAKTREVLRLHNLPTAPAYVVRGEAGEHALDCHGAFGFPVLVRPVGASTATRAVASDEGELEGAVEDALRLDDHVLVERHVEGRTLTVAVLDGVALGAMETSPASAGARPSSPRLPPLTAKITAARYRSILRMATAAYEALGCEGAACVEMVVSDRLNEVIVEVDAHPLLTATAPLAGIAQRAGLPFSSLVQEILAGARLRAHGHRQNRRAVQVGFEGPDRRAAALNAH